MIPLGGHRVVECATDGAGVVVEQLSEDLDALLVTPSHLYPVGGAMPAARRGELLDWAARTNTVLIEDDFNSELRYRLSPQPTLSTLAPDAQVLTLGTFSTLLSRELAAGYVVAPRGLADQLRGVRQVLGMPVSAVTQRAIANLLQGGVVRRTTRTVHLRLAKRRERLEKDLFPALGHLDCEVQLSNTGGADLTVRFPSEVVQQRFEDSLLRLGVECGHKAALWSDGGSGLVLSFAHLSDGDFERALRAVVSAEAEQRMSAEDSQHRQ